MHISTSFTLRENLTIIRLQAVIVMRKLQLKKLQRADKAQKKIIEDLQAQIDDGIQQLIDRGMTTEEIDALLANASQ
jgi:hypothetical protein